MVGSVLSAGLKAEDLDDKEKVPRLFFAILDFLVSAGKLGPLLSSEGRAAVRKCGRGAGCVHTPQAPATVAEDAERSHIAP